MPSLTIRLLCEEQADLLALRDECVGGAEHAVETRRTAGALRGTVQLDFEYDPDDGPEE